MVIWFAGSTFCAVKGGYLNGYSEEICDLYRVDQEEIGRVCRTPGDLRGRLFGKNDVIMGDGQCLTDGELIKDFRASNISNSYQFRNVNIRQTAAVDFAE